MTGGQVAALIFALILLLPGGCFFILGAGMTIEWSDSIDKSLGPLALVVGVGVLSLTGLLFWVAFRRRRPPESGRPPAMPPSATP